MCQTPHEVFSLYGSMDQWDCVREFAPAGTYRYYAPQGELITFDYTPTAGATSTYCLHSDATYGIRAITDSAGAIVAHYETDAWGNLLASSFDISFGFNYRFVGAAGVRWDATLGMYYMRQRWYSPTLQRFISRDPVRSSNRYVYCVNSPINYIDPLGLQPVMKPHWEKPVPTSQPMMDIDLRFPPAPIYRGGSVTRADGSVRMFTGSELQDWQLDIEGYCHCPSGYEYENFYVTKVRRIGEKDNLQIGYNQFPLPGSGLGIVGMRRQGTDDPDVPSVEMTLPPPATAKKLEYMLEGYCVCRKTGCPTDTRNGVMEFQRGHIIWFIPPEIDNERKRKSWNPVLV